MFYTKLLICHNYMIFIKGLFVMMMDAICLQPSSYSSLTATAGRLSSMNFVIDCMHFKGHTDVWCHQHYDPNKLKELFC